MTSAFNTTPVRVAARRGRSSIGINRSPEHWPPADIAELLGVAHTTASRLATRAETAGLIDKRPNPIDQREVGCRLSVNGRDAVAVCLDVVRPLATDILRPPDVAACVTRR